MKPTDFFAMEHITQPELHAVLNAVREKALYYDLEKRYQNKSFFEKMLSLRPVDNYKDYSMEQLCSSATYAFRKCFPELNGQQLAPDGDFRDVSTRLGIDSDGNMRIYSDCSVFHPKGAIEGSVEVFEFVPGKGFIYNHQSGPRFEQSFFEEYYQRLDSIRYGDVFMKKPDLLLDKASFSNVMKRIEVDRRLDVANEELISGRASPFRKDYSVDSFQTFLRNELLYPSKDISSFVDSPYSRYQLVDRMKGIQANEHLSEVELYRLSLKESIPKNSLEELCRHYLFDKDGKEKPDLLQNISSFVGAAFDSGYEGVAIESFVSSYMAGNHPDISFKPKYEVIERERAGVYFSYVISETAQARKLGIRDVCQLKIQTPCERFEESFSRVRELSSIVMDGSVTNSVSESRNIELTSQLPSAGREFMVIGPEEVRKGLLPDGVEGHVTPRGGTYVSFSGETGGLEVAGDGLFLVRRQSGKGFEAYNRESFEKLFNVRPDGTVERKKNTMSLNRGKEKKTLSIKKKS